ncbi:transglycosylase domain-containing protein [Dethiothermospora halolimnae]|uniref:transglycosylase domain-containing protein n=1 Tax=Dethiothermospora halolimnae TaxID=3114390 RepID=UPI003CCBDC58
MKKLIGILMIITLLIAGISVFASDIDGNKYSINDNLIEELSQDIDGYTEIENMPKDLINAVVAIEDKRFFSHSGFDLVGIGRAFVNNIKAGEIKEGGSTISQQLAKNLFLSNEKTLNRKAKELILSIKLEEKYTKEEILEMYLNVIYLGDGAYGVQDASKKYFNKDVSQLTTEECAMLAGLPQAPSLYNPKKYINRAKKRQKMVIKAMVEEGFIEEGFVKKGTLKPI